MKNTNYLHFEEWIADWRRNNHDEAKTFNIDDDLIGLYLSIYPGRTESLVIELIEVARVWSREQEIVAEVREANDASSA